MRKLSIGVSANIFFNLLPVLDLSPNAFTMATDWNYPLKSLYIVHRPLKSDSQRGLFHPSGELTPSPDVQLPRGIRADDICQHHGGDNDLRG